MRFEVGDEEGGVDLARDSAGDGFEEEGDLVAVLQDCGSTTLSLAPYSLPLSPSLYQSGKEEGMQLTPK